MWLSNSTLARLRDQLRERGQRPSVVMPNPHLSAEVADAMNVVVEYGPLCEAMYLMMSADGRVTNDEREVLTGALRNLSGGALRGAQIESLLDAAAKSVAEQGREKRMRDVIASLHEDTPRAEVAFVLAAAIAFADGTIADQENDTLSLFAEGFGITEERANELLDAVEDDLGGDPTTRGPTLGIPSPLPPKPDGTT
jgi:tellurite resistance protein